MTTTTTPEIEQLHKQLKEKGKEIRDLYQKLVQGGAKDVIPDDFLDQLIF